MSVTLRIEFAGLCLYVLDKDKDGVTQRVGVVMPNCRNNDNNVDSRHADGTIGEPHVAYMRLDAGSLGIGPVSGESGDGPRVELIHRLLGELLLPIEDATPRKVIGEPLVPILNSQHGDIALKPDLFTTAHPDIVFRTVLVGGHFVAKRGGKTWRFPSSLRGTFAAQTAPFEGTVVWEREFKSLEAIKLTMTSLDGTAPMTFPDLKPLAQHGDHEGRSLVMIKLANLCAHNPIEWDELDLRVVQEDKDFKWLFRLLDDTSRIGDWATRLDDRPLPFPVLDDNSMEGDEDCTGGKFYGSF